mmetsp:Transcript_617/g.1739  ORF Transcript_617/g.1739 Transcript_617/m.1739 type:complete len:242 (+) Transcript_617:744-1469(+)
MRHGVPEQQEGVERGAGELHHAPAERHHVAADGRDHDDEDDVEDEVVLLQPVLLLHLAFLNEEEAGDPDEEGGQKGDHELKAERRRNGGPHGLQGAHVDGAGDGRDPDDGRQVDDVQAHDQRVADQRLGTRLGRVQLEVAPHHARGAWRRGDHPLLDVGAERDGLRHLGAAAVVEGHEAVAAVHAADLAGGRLDLGPLLRDLLGGGGALLLEELDVGAVALDGGLLQTDGGLLLASHGSLK